MIIIRKTNNLLLIKELSKYIIKDIRILSGKPLHNPIKARVRIIGPHVIISKLRKAIDKKYHVLRRPERKQIAKTIATELSSIPDLRHNYEIITT
jgi:hypothetical protein